MYLVTQFSTDKNFGQVKLYVPRGNYKMVAIAAATDNPSKDNKVSIKSKTEVVFPKNEVKDMFYTYQDIAVKDREKKPELRLHTETWSHRIAAQLP